MPTIAEWKQLIAQEMSIPAMPVAAETYRGLVFQSHSAPVAFGCNDGHDYVVKSIRDPVHRRVLVNDRIMGTLAQDLGSPVPPVALIEVPKGLADAVNAGGIAHGRSPIMPGLAHGSRYRPDISQGREGFREFNRPINRPRFAALAMLYGVAFVMGDHQFFYENQTAAVISVDHGHFFPQGPGWTVNSLTLAPPGAADTVICTTCGLTADELKAAAAALRDLTRESIIRAVAAPPSAWDIILDERAELAFYLDKRRAEIVAAHPS